MSPDGCRGQRSTLPWRPLQRDLRHAGGGPAESGPEITLIGLGRGRQPDQDAFHRFNLRPCGQSRLTRAPCYVCPRYTPHPSHPLRIDRPRQGTGRRMRLPRRRSARLSARLTTTGKMRLPDFCNRLTTRVPYRTARFSNHRLPPLSPGGRLPLPLARPKPCRRRDRVELV